MKTLALTLLSFIFFNVTAQDITGKWQGAIEVQSSSLKLVFHITQEGNSYSATMDSPDQGAYGIPVSEISYALKILKLKVAVAALSFEGNLSDANTIEGTFQQGGLTLPLVLKKKTEETKEIKRPQDPKTPLPYYSEEIIFKNNKAGITLAGTLTLPEKEGKFPAVVLISGSGPQNRDEELMGHKPFLVLADHLTRQGLAVLRYDDRGTAASEGNFARATTYDLADDAAAAFDYLQSRKEIDTNKTGLIGHSEGGIIAPLLASENTAIRFVVLMAGPSLRGDQLLLLQKEKIETAMGAPAAKVKSNREIFAGIYAMIIENKLQGKALSSTIDAHLQKNYDQLLPTAQRQQAVKQITNPWMLVMIRLDPAVYLKKLNCPTLALYGSKDLQVPAKENIETLKKIKLQTGKNNIDIVELNNLNHLFQECENGLVSEYGKIEQTISPVALESISMWLKQQTR